MSDVVVRTERRKRWTCTAACVTGAMTVLLLGGQVDTAKGETGGGERLPRPVELLIGPIPPMAMSKDWRAFDSLQLGAGKKYAESFPTEPNDLTGSNFYDLALTLYAIHYRTNDTYWRNRARYVAQTWRDSVNNANILKCLAGQYEFCGNSIAPRGASTLGLAILAIENNDAAAKQVVYNQALMMRLAFSRNWGDGRENGYALMVFLCTHLLGFTDFDADALRLLNINLNAQQPNGQWIGRIGSDTGPQVTINYMNGILMEALIMYDRVIGDPRILPAIQRGADWTWNAQWVASAQGFQYADRVVNTPQFPKWTDMTPTPNLSGLLLPAWGYLYAKTGDAKYLSQGTQILNGLLEQGGKQIWGVKQFTQMFRSSSRYLGYLALAPPPK